MTNADTEEKRPFWAKCWTCGHIWPCAYMPMTLAMTAKVIGNLLCPMCGEGSKKIGIAKQDNGVLQEPNPCTAQMPSEGK